MINCDFDWLTSLIKDYKPTPIPIWPLQMIHVVQTKIWYQTLKPLSLAYDNFCG